MATIKSIEEKAKAYDEALVYTKKLLKTIGNATLGNLVLKNEFKNMFPALEESEDERIRKRIIHALHGDVLEMSEIKEAVDWLEKQGNLMKALQISNAKIGELVEKNYYLKEQLEKQGKNNMGISEATKQKLEDNLNKALEKETPESCNEFLEKQGEQKTTIEMKTPEESLGIDSDIYNKIVDECIYGEQKPDDKSKIKPKFKTGDRVIGVVSGMLYFITNVCDDHYNTESGCIIMFCAQDNFDLYEQKPAEWHREDEQNLNACLGYIPDEFLRRWLTDIIHIKYDEPADLPKGEDYGIDGLYAAIDILQKTLGEVDGYQSDDGILEHKCAISAVKELSKQKPAWGEEDIELLDNTIKFIEDRVAATSPSLRTYSPTLTGKEIPFLKSLKERYTWRPSDEQMKGIECTIKTLKYQLNVGDNRLDSLYNDLKKLREV